MYYIQNVQKNKQNYVYNQFYVLFVYLIQLSFELVNEKKKNKYCTITTVIIVKFIDLLYYN